MNKRTFNYVVAAMGCIVCLMTEQWIGVSTSFFWFMEMYKRDEHTKILLTTIDILSKQVTEKFDKLKNK